ncbi:hypothetical protein [Ruminococcus sp.]|uniref:hypothetical protein n=1 Tax=Ruminococcus sp. TaxID=41978 RepID=UPI0025FC8F06|nr:hypothetical protein [Ruminococcus sp.]
MEKVKVLTSLLEERSGLDVRKALARHYEYMTNEEAENYDAELEYLLNYLYIEVELPF